MHLYDCFDLLNCALYFLQMASIAVLNPRIALLYLVPELTNYLRLCACFCGEFGRYCWCEIYWLEAKCGNGILYHSIKSRIG